MIKNKKRILVLGSTGQVGTALLKKIKQTEYDLIHPDRNELNLTVLSEVFSYISLHKPDILINCAAFTNVEKAEEQPMFEINKINCELPKKLAELSLKFNFILIHYSTDYVFDGKLDTPYIEDSPHSPLNQYGLSKSLGDMHVINSINEGAEALIFRVSWVYSFSHESFVSKVLSKARNNEKIKIVSDQLGAPTSANLIAKQTIEILNFILNAKPLQMVWGVYNLAPHGECSWYTFAKYLLEAKGLRQDLIVSIHSKELQLKALRPLNSRLDNKKIIKQFSLEFPFWFEDFNNNISL